MYSETIYALSTVFGKSGVAVIRISGKSALSVIDKMTEINPDNIKPRYAYFTNILDTKTKNVLDKSVVLYFKSPHSFTGEDVVEIQCHGSKAVLNSVFKSLECMDNLRLAEAGEFSKRAFYNNKMDLTEAEGLADLIDAETSEQQKYAIKQLEGNLRNLYSSWRQNLVKVLSYLEAYIDFPDEDIPQNLYDDILNTVFKTKTEIENHLKNNNISDRLKNGFNIVIAGSVNAGKSSLINALTKSNTMIVSDIEGTTRDSVDINLDLGGYPVVITDTAGIRQTDNPIEKIGIDIALNKIKKADIILALYDASIGYFDKTILPQTSTDIIYVANKSDKLSPDDEQKIKESGHFLISAKYDKGIDKLVTQIINILKDKFSSSSNTLITRVRYREALEDCLDSLKTFSLDKEIELSTEDLRLACRAIGKITGEVKISELLDNIFGSFCIGK